MRRGGECPAGRPSSYRHSLFRDNKTMLEGVRAGSAFTYLVNDAEIVGPLDESDLASVEAVVLTMRADVAGEMGSVSVETTARVGR